MTALTIRDVPEDAVRTMKIRAAQSGRVFAGLPPQLDRARGCQTHRGGGCGAGRRQATADISTTDISPQSTRDEPDVDRHRLLGHGRTAGSEDADRRCHRSPGDRSADPVCAVRARRVGRSQRFSGSDADRKSRNQKPTPRSPITARSPSNGRTPAYCELPDPVNVRLRIPA